jgi:mono/diheme cytochrome c family protein
MMIRIARTQLPKKLMKLSSLIPATCCVLLMIGCSHKMKEPAARQKPDSTLAQGQGASILPAVRLTYEQGQGKYLYDKECAVCHGDKGGGDGFNAYNLDPKPQNLADSAYAAALTDASLEQIIAQGGRGVNKSVLMPAYRWTLNRRQISYLVAYLRTFAQNGNAAQ